MKRRRKQLGDMAQAESPGVTAGAVPAAPGPVGLGRFIDDRPEGLRVGTQRLDAYLQSHALGWVVELRRIVEGLDYTPLLVAYTGTGRPPFHPRTLLGLVVYGILRRAWALRELEELAVRDVGRGG